ncbi:MAG: hypothetical protein HC922_05075 [Leptolyngbyaceae cyanobacterium SM2_3_12]|nr:hypothetical protein [Leptolyngbyaceae cyanobacterium SM2_3_12]
MNVNLSGKKFVRPDLIYQIDQALEINGLEGQYLKVEITESVLIQNSQMAIDLLGSCGSAGSRSASMTLVPAIPPSAICTASPLMCLKSISRLLPI